MNNEEANNLKIRLKKIFTALFILLFGFGLSFYFTLEPVIKNHLWDDYRLYFGTFIVFIYWCFWFFSIYFVVRILPKFIHEKEKIKEYSKWLGICGHILGVIGSFILGLTWGYPPLIFFWIFYLIPCALGFFATLFYLLMIYLFKKKW